MSVVTYCARSTPATPPRDRGIDHALGRLLDNLVEQGSFALRQLEREQANNSREFRVLLDAGLIHGGPDGRLQVTPRALQACEERLLTDLLQGGGGGAALGRHREGGSPHFAEAGDEPRAYQAGEPLTSLDLSGTLGRALERGWPVRLREDDIVVRPGLGSGRCATVLLLDLSGSMARHGKFSAARRAALALRALLRRRFVGDELFTAGFATRAEPLPGVALLEARPRDVGLFDPTEDAQRLPADSAVVPGHFTNIQDGLRLARGWLRGKANLGKQIFLITDGEPTAHLEGDELVLAYPPTPATQRHTLLEARRCAAAGINVHVFGLVGEFSPPGLAEFVEFLARSGNGSAVCCSPRQIGASIVTAFTRSRPAQR